MKKYNLSITVGKKSYVCNNVNNQDIIIDEFSTTEEANKFIDKHFIKIKTNCHTVGYNIYKKRWLVLNLLRD